MSAEGLNDIPLPDRTTKAIAVAVVQARKALQAIPHGPQTESYTIGLDTARSNLQQAIGCLEHLLERAAPCH